MFYILSKFFMNNEISQQQKFEEQFHKLAEQASPKFKDKWDKLISA